MGVGTAPPNVAITVTVPPEYPKSPIHQIPPLDCRVQVSLLEVEFDAQSKVPRVGLDPPRMNRSTSPVPKRVTDIPVGPAGAEIE